MNFKILIGILLFNISNNIGRKCFKSSSKNREKYILYSKLLENLYIPGLHCYIVNLNILYYLIFQHQQSLEMAYIISTSYYSYDLIRIINNYNYNMFDNVFLLHHILTLGLLQYNLSFYGSYYYIVGELSNIFYFPVYYCIKMKITGNIKKILSMIQFISYVFCRIFIISYVFYLSCLVDPTLNIIIGSPIYIMGFVWSYNLYLKL
jgi:hypothetical protein